MTSMRNRNSVGPASPARRTARRTLAALATAALLVAGLQNTARADVALYQATVPLRGATEADRAAALGEALKVAAVRASGRKDAATALKIAAAAAEPSSYVQQYGTTPDRGLKVGFDARAMEQLLQQAGLPLWPAERPSVSVFLFTPAVEGGARALMASDRVPERIELERAAQARGVSLAWPVVAVGTSAARGKVGAADAVLVGQAVGTSIDWSFTHAGQSAGAAGGPAAGADLAADELARRYAPNATRSVAQLELRIGGLQGVREYAALLQYLEGLSLVRDVQVREFAADAVRLAISARGDRELLARIFALDGRVRPVGAAEGASAGAVDFVWQAP
jgi:hypothetical protein